MLLKFDPYGIYCPQANVYIDPWKPVKNAIITHAHADHAKWGNENYLSHHLSIPILKFRLGDINVQGVEYGEEIIINGVKISLHPAGHIPGSAQVRLEYKGEIWCASGDYKLQLDGISTPFEPVRCHHFVTESTFGLPIYRFPDSQTVHQDMNDWWLKNKEEEKTSVIIGYALGKAQRIIKHLDPAIGTIYTHGAVDNLNRILEKTGLELPPTKRIISDTNKSLFKGNIVVAPPSAIGSPWMKRFLPYSVAICSGWMQLRGTRRRKSADRGFVLSDHADWAGLNQAIKETGAENVYVTHGYKSAFAKWLRENLHINAVEVDTLYEGESLNESTTPENEIDS
ncbi:ligase-associated DNA damage response exonuclease [Pedobacter cryophilus]|uniref:Ligase-associated DNA damage response exonuclease n=1 Tax=Pedobacter cryophilus TaxID=2571271 RepID=A0A4U1BWP7_9SPHI|nr:ligase-associated DNA damage response exonuclease [Pedobacter cryophilus]TKB96764.1 ligase-associated DNA damage response exonuclease [Pedobacter cryophilus]